MESRAECAFLEEEGPCGPSVEEREAGGTLVEDSVLDEETADTAVGIEGAEYMEGTVEEEDGGTDNSETVVENPSSEGRSFRIFCKVRTAHIMRALSLAVECSTIFSRLERALATCPNASTYDFLAAPESQKKRQSSEPTEED